MTKKRLLIGLATLALAGAACTPGNNFRDVEGVPSQDPDKVFMYNNVDMHPNIAVVCIKGVAFITTTREYGDAIQRVPDLDKVCP